MLRNSKRAELLIIGPGITGRGGITSVIRLYQMAPTWSRMNARMLSTYSDRSSIHKIWTAVKSYLIAPFVIMRAEIVHIHLAGEVSLMRKLPLLLMAKTLQKRSIVHVHAFSEESLFEKTPRWAWEYCLHGADLVIALSPSWEKAIKKNATGARVVVVPNPVRSFARSIRKQSASPRVLYVGKLEVRKGYDTLLDAAAIVLKEFPQAEFWFAGHGELDVARIQAERHGILSKVHLLGWVGGTELERIYEDANIFCLPSHNEGVPMSMLEAMSHSLPVICTPVGGIPDVIEDGANGLLVKPGDPDSIAAGILRLLRDPELARLIAQSGKKKVEAMCSLEVIEAQMMSIYLDLAQPRRGARMEVRHDT